MMMKTCFRRMVLADHKIDLGVRFGSGRPLVRVDSGHQRLKSGQYTFRDGEYGFSTRDVGTTIIFEVK